MNLEGNWFSEECEESGSAFSLKHHGRLHEERTPYQKIEIYATTHFGNLMVIDGFVMLSQRDHFIYHEMITHPALFTHPAPRRVLVIGGGDCGSLREVLRHPEITQVQQVELDERVTRLSEQYFPELCECNADPRAEFHFTDGIRWIEGAESGGHDVIIVDSTDPVGQAVRLYSTGFYAGCLRALGEHGILVAQSESPLIHLDLLRSMRDNMHAAGFTRVTTLNFPQCTYPSGWWSATLASREPLQDFREADAETRPFTTRYYDPQVHHAALALPPFVRRALET